MIFKKTIAAAALVVASAATATTANADEHFAGAYFGGIGAVTFGPLGGGGGANWSAGLTGGYDVQFGQFVAGVGTSVTYTFGFPDPEDFINIDGFVRGGVVFGNILAYGKASFGGAINSVHWWSAGGGIEFEISPAVHVFAEGRFTKVYDTGGFLDNYAAIQAGVVLRRDN